VSSGLVSGVSGRGTFVSTGRKAGLALIGLIKRCDE
jgi:hypothetical protein